MYLSEYINKYPNYQSIYDDYGSGKGGVGIYTDFDWRRIFSAMELCIEGTLLDIGPGKGQFLRVALDSHKFSQINSVDYYDTKNKIPDGVLFTRASVSDLSIFPDKCFDNVVCMEVLEHISIQDFELALKELRRVSKSRLLITLPYNEAKPLFMEGKPGGHQQSFNIEQLNAMFRGNYGFFCRNYGTDWLMIVEDPDIKSKFDCLTIVSDNVAFKIFQEP